MWETLKRAPRGRLSLRNFVMFFATLLVANLLYLTSVSVPVHAVPGEHSANWNGTTLSYNAQDYTGPYTATANDPSRLPEGTLYFVAYDDANASTTTGHLIIFPKGTQLANATKATYITGEYDVTTGRFSDLSPPKQIDVDSSTYGGEEAIAATSCDVDGIGWLICPVSRWIAEGMDTLYGIIANFLTVTPLTTQTGSLYQAWKFVLNIANLCFVLGFLVIIYYYITGTVDAKYGIRKIIPRVVIVAILVNASYWIVAVGVDASNILGYSVQQLFVGLRDQLGAANSAADDIGWKAVTTVVLGGGAAAGAGVGALGSLTAFGGVSFSLLLIGALIPALFAVFVAVVILAARQALITVFIILAPLAFVAYLLPNTEEWFTRWRKFFMSLLIMFPAFSAIFGGAQLAGIIIIQNAPANNYGIAVVILGLVVQTIPLFITPFLIRLSSGLLGTIAGMTNNKGKGVFDRAKNWTDDRRDYHKVRAMKNAANMQGGSRWLRPTTYGSRMAMNKHHRERMKSAYTAQAEAAYERSGRGQRAYDETRTGEDEKGNSKHRNEELYQRRLAGDVNWADRSLSEQFVPGVAERRDRRYAGQVHRLHEGHAAGVRGEAIKEGIHAEGERHAQEAINNAATGTYEDRIRARRIQTSVDKGIAEMNSKEIDASGKAALQREIFDTPDLKAMNVRTVSLEKEAATIENVLRQRAEAQWERTTTDMSDRNFNESLRNLRLQEVESERTLETSKKKWTELVENITAQGANAPGIVSTPDKTTAGRIKAVSREGLLVDKAIEAAKIVQNESLVADLKENEELRIRAGGIGGKRAQTRIYAKAKEDVVSAAVQEVKTNRSLTSEMTRRQLHALMQSAVMPDGSEATVEMQQAAMYALLQEKGNNEDANEIRDVVSKMGMMVDDDGNYYEALRDSSGKLIRNASGFPQIDYSKRITDQIEIGRRRDWQQFFDDAAGGSPHSMVTYSGTNKSEARAGTMVDGMRDGFMRDTISGKFSPEKLLKADIDELKFLLEDLHSPDGHYASLDASDQKKVRDTLESAIIRLQSNETINASIDDRNRGAMNDMLALINPGEYGFAIVDGERSYLVDKNKAIIARSKADAIPDTTIFNAPINVPGVHNRDGTLVDQSDPNHSRYYKEWDVDLQL